MSCQDLNFVPCPMRFSCPTQGCYRENKPIRENWQVKMFAVAGVSRSRLDAFIEIVLEGEKLSYNPPKNVVMTAQLTTSLS